MDEPPDVVQLGGLGGAVFPLAILAVGAGGALPAFPPAPLNFVVGLVYLLHLFGSQVRQGIVHVVIRVIFPGQLAVGGFNLIIGGAGGNPQYLVGVSHSFPLLSPPGGLPGP